MRVCALGRAGVHAFGRAGPGGPAGPVWPILYMAHIIRAGIICMWAGGYNMYLLYIHDLSHSRLSPSFSSSSSSSSFSTHNGRPGAAQRALKNARGVGSCRSCSLRPVVRDSFSCHGRAGCLCAECGCTSVGVGVGGCVSACVYECWCGCVWVWVWVWVGAWVRGCEGA